MRSGTGLWAAQRITAAFLAFAVLLHLVTILYAVRGGLSAGEIIGRLRGAEIWLGFYTLFAVSAGLHAAIGLRNIAAEWWGWRRLDLAWLGIGLLTATFGIRAAWGLYNA
jgi:fumarate reductase subunit C